jgi:predicted ATPase
MIEVALSDARHAHFVARLDHEGTRFGGWIDRAAERYRIRPGPTLTSWRIVLSDDPNEDDAREWALLDQFQRAIVQTHLDGVARALQVDKFLIYTPHEEVLRDLARDSGIEPVGIHGEGLFALLQSLDVDQLAALKQQLALIHWFADLEILPGPTPSQHSLKIVDQYLADGLAHFDQRSANEGFLFLLLYACLLISQHTPRFFAVDNVDTSLNPKLAAGAVRMFAELCREHDRQVLLTTHNPGTLDGLDLADDDQRLFVVYRNLEGRTRARRIQRDPAAKDPVRLSEAFLRGYLGGLPNHF